MDYNAYGGWVWQGSMLRPDKSDSPIFDHDEHFDHASELRRVEERDGPANWAQPHHIVLGDGLLRIGVTGMTVAAYALYPIIDALDELPISTGERLHHALRYIAPEEWASWLNVSVDYANESSPYMHCSFIDEHGVLWYGEVGIGIGSGFESEPMFQPSRLIDLLSV